MMPREIRPKEVKILVNEFIKDKNFLASAVTMPLKNKFKTYITYGNKLSQIAGSINLIVKIKKKLFGYNTDISAAIKSLPLTKKKKIMIFGLGGTGKPLAKVLSKKNKDGYCYCVSSKRHIDIKNKNLIIKKKIDNNVLKEIDIFINCSPLGSNLNKKFIRKSPLNMNQINLMKKKAFVFDIVYKPHNTLLKKQCEKNKIKYINGLRMNSLQAEEALNIVFKNIR